MMSSRSGRCDLGGGCSRYRWGAVAMRMGADGAADGSIRSR